MNKIQSYSNNKKIKIEQGRDIIDTQLLQNNNWEKTKQVISLNLKEIIWKAWIEPLNFIK